MLVLVATAAACSSGSAPILNDHNPGELRYQPCPPEGLVGRFTIDRDHGAAFVSGQVFDGPLPSLEKLAVQGDCRLLKVSVYSCEPPCGAGTTCGPAATCMPAPSPRSLGSVTVEVLGRPIVMAPSDSQSYSSPNQPPYQDGADVGLATSGGAYAPFTIWARGVASMKIGPEPLRSEIDRPLPVTWTPPAARDDRVRVQIAIELAVHRDAVSIECDVADTGAFDVPTELMTQLRSVARSLPGKLLESDVVLRRRSVDSAAIQPGCVELDVRTPATVAFELGCSGDLDCFPGQRCDAALHACL
jgi:hypothetical protein